MQCSKLLSGMALLGVFATFSLWGCGGNKSEPNQASPALTPAETVRNEPPPRDDSGKPVQIEKPTMDGPGEIVGRDRSAVK